MGAEDERWPKRARFWRSFVATEAVDQERNYHAPWNNLETLREWVVQGKWVLITGPFQSGKSSLMYALSDAVVADGLLPVVTTLTEDMIYAANNTDLGQGQREFFGRLAMSIEDDSQGSLRIRPQDRELGDMGLVSGMFRSSDKEIVWFVDEVSLLNDIIHPTILTKFLSGLRSCKQGARSKHKTGSYSLRSFVLVGTARTRRLLAHDRGKRLKAADNYVTTSPSRVHDPYNPFTGTGSFSPLSVEETTGGKFLSKQEIFQMLSDYAQERGIIFRTQVEEGDVTDDSRVLAIYKFAKNIHELTSGYKGMVGTCCTYICGKSIHTYSVWRQKVRKGSVAKKVFTDKVYTKILSKVPSYGEELQKFVLECIQFGGKAAPPSTLDTLPAINDGVLKSVGGGYLALSSPLLLSAILEDCYMAPREALPPVAVFDDSLRFAFTYIKPDRLALEEVLNRNGQPSEYIWQSEFFLGLKFVLEHGYTVCAYKILVEAKGKDKDGKRTMRLDFFLKNSGSPKKGIEVQGAGNEDSIRSHIKRCGKYRELHGCDMHYVYFLVGEDNLGAMDVIARESLQVQGLQCWYVCYLTQSRRWTVGQYNQGGRNWDLRVLDVPNSYPEFLFQNTSRRWVMLWNTDPVSCTCCTFP